MLTLQPTDDGSLTSFCEENGERYHNRNGAWEETEAIYMKPSRFKERLAEKNTLHIMDPFFGLGYISLGCTMAFYDVLKETPNTEPKKLVITAVENDPAILEHFGAICDQFDHPMASLMKKQVAEDLFHPENLLAHKIYYQTHEDESPEITPFLLTIDLSGFQINATIEFRFYLADIRSVLPQLLESAQQKPEQFVFYDCIYHDPFSPKKMPELWTQTIFEHYKALLSSPQGIVFTYSQSSAIRGGLQEAGLVIKRPFVEKYPKSGTCGLLNGFYEKSTHLTLDLHELSSKEIYLLNSRAGLSYVDNKALNLSRDEIMHTRKEALLKTNRMGSSEAIRRAEKLTATQATY